MMDETIESVSKWADETFGPSTPEATLSRSLDEIRELSHLVHPLTMVLKNQTEFDHPKLVEEAADVCITLYRYIYLVEKEAINKKMVVNRLRKWKLNGDGTDQHIKEGGVGGNGHEKEGG